VLDKGGANMKPQCTPTGILRFVCATVIVGLVATGCSTYKNTEATPPDASMSSTPSHSPSQQQSEPTQQQSEPGTQPVGEFSTGNYESDNWPDFGDAKGVYPVAMRSAVHDGFERIVIEHAGTGTPSMLARYTDEPMAPGSGAELGIDQDAVLEVVWSGTSSIDDMDVDQLMQVNDPITDLNTTAAQSVVVFPPFEATSSYFIGLDEQRPYAVKILQDPVRLVVDIQTD